MKCNLKAFGVTRYINQEGREILSMRIATTDGGINNSPMLHCAQHIREFVQDLRGNASSMGSHVFNDLSYYLEAYTDGIRMLIHQSGMTSRERYKDPDASWGYSYRTIPEPDGFVRRMLTIPGHVIADVIDKTRLNFRVKDLSKGLSAEITEAQAKAIRREYRERVEVRWMQDEAYERLHEALRGPHRESIKHCISGCLRIARNNSLGNLVELEICTDGEKSFYWRIVNRGDEQRPGPRILLMNGGWILHGENGYSSHA